MIIIIVSIHTVAIERDFWAESDTTFKETIGRLELLGIEEDEAEEDDWRRGKGKKIQKYSKKSLSWIFLKARY